LESSPYDDSGERIDHAIPVTMTTISIAIRDWQSASDTQNDNDVNDRSPSTITIMIIMAIKNGILLTNLFFTTIITAAN
jgi:hypothetical protein